MATPLYKTVIENAAECDEKGNKGLWFDRFFDQYDENKKWEVLKPSTNDADKGNAHWLNTHFHNKKVGNDAQLTSHSTQQQQLAKGLQGNSHIFSADWHFVTGMGNPHPVENGFAWHPTLGVPYLTGAAVKGIVRNYIENYFNDEENDIDKKELLLNWFGSTSKDSSADGYISETGNIIFFDALPIEPVTLVVDIMTPHMGDWYQNGAEKPNTAETVPADWHDPVPVTFLACKNISLQFSYALRQYPNDEKYTPKAIELDDVKKVLTQALEYFGAGGKTATGYGQFYSDNKREVALEQQAKEQQEAQKAQQELEQAKSSMSPLAGEFFAYAQEHNLKSDKNAFWKEGMVEEWLEKLEENYDKELHKQLIELMNIHFKGAIANPEKTQGKKKKAVYKPRVQKIAKHINSLST